MIEDGLTVRPTKQATKDTLDKAFKVQELDALVAVNPQPPELPTPQEDKIISAVADDDAKLKREDRLSKRQQRITNKQIGEAMVDIARWTIRGVVGWYAFVALAVTGYMIGGVFGLTLLPEKALITLLGTVAVAAIVSGVSKVIIALKAHSD